MSEVFGWHPLPLPGSAVSAKPLLRWRCLCGSVVVGPFALVAAGMLVACTSASPEYKAHDPWRDAEVIRVAPAGTINFRVSPECTRASGSGANPASEGAANDALLRYREGSPRHWVFRTVLVPAPANTEVGRWVHFNRLSCTVVPDATDGAGSE